MKTERKKMGIEKFISNYFSNLGKFILLNLAFALPLAVSFGLCYLVCKFLLPYPTLVLPFSIILAAPFYSGVVVVSKNIYYDEVTFGIFSEYITAVKENFKAFILHGIVAYVAVVGCYHGIVIYNSLSYLSPVFYAMLFMSVLLAVLLLFFFFGLSMMSAFFDLKLKDVYRNSVLMSFGEIKVNFLAAVGVVAFLAVVSLPVMIFGFLSLVWGDTVSLYVITGYCILAVLLLVPSGVCAIITACIYPDMKRVITGEAKKNIEAIRKEDEQERIKEETKAPEFSDINIAELEKSSGEYVFYNGKMIKKSYIMEELKEREGK